MTNATETALIVPVPEVEPIVGRFRAVYDPAAAAGVPAHVTVVPLRPPSRISADVIHALGEIFDDRGVGRGVRGDGRFPRRPLFRAGRGRAISPSHRARRRGRYPEAPPMAASSQTLPHLTIAHSDRRSLTASRPKSRRHTATFPPRDDSGRRTDRKSTAGGERGCIPLKLSTIAYNPVNR